MLPFTFQLLAGGFTGGILYLILCVFQHFTLKKLSLKWHYYIHLFVFSFLFLPYDIISSMIYNMFNRIFISNPDIQENIVIPDKINPNTSGLPVKVINHFSEYRSNINTTTMYQILSYLICMGIAVSLLLFLYKYMRFSYLLSKNCESMTDEQTLEIFNTIKRKFRIRRKILLSRYSGNCSPFIFGIFRPCIYLPIGAISKKELTAVFTHELTHYKRGDNWMKPVITILSTFYWFNPFIYFQLHSIDSFCELSCDERVVLNMDHSERRWYCSLILRLLRNTIQSNSALYPSFSNQKKQVEMRMCMILRSGNNQKGRKSVRIMAAAIMAATLLLGSGILTFAASTNVPAAPSVETTGPLQLTGEVDNINIPLAKEQEIGNPIVKEAPSIEGPSSILDKVSDDRPALFGTSAPISFWNLSNAVDNGQFTGVSNARGIYTNYYFAPNANNTIYLSNTVTGQNSTSQQYYVRLYNYNTGAKIYENLKTASTTKWYLTYSGLTANQFYYVQWIAVGDNKYIDGTFSVYR